MRSTIAVGKILHSQSGLKVDILWYHGVISSQLSRTLLRKTNCFCILSCGVKSHVPCDTGGSATQIITCNLQVQNCSREDPGCNICHCDRPSGTLLKNRTPFILMYRMWHKGPVLRPRCIWPGRTENQLLFYSLLSRIRLRIPIIRIQGHLFHDVSLVRSTLTH